MCIIKSLWIPLTQNHCLRIKYVFFWLSDGYTFIFSCLVTHCWTEVVLADIPLSLHPWRPNVPCRIFLSSLIGNGHLFLFLVYEYFYYKPRMFFDQLFSTYMEILTQIFSYSVNLIINSLVLNWLSDCLICGIDSVNINTFSFFEIAGISMPIFGFGAYVWNSANIFVFNNCLECSHVPKPPQKWKEQKILCLKELLKIHALQDKKFFISFWKFISVVLMDKNQVFLFIFHIKDLVAVSLSLKQA